MQKTQGGQSPTHCLDPFQVTMQASVVATHHRCRMSARSLKFHSSQKRALANLTKNSLGALRTKLLIAPKIHELQVWAIRHSVSDSLASCVTETHISNDHFS